MNEVLAEDESEVSRPAANELRFQPEISRARTTREDEGSLFGKRSSFVGTVILLKAVESFAERSYSRAGWRPKSCFGRSMIQKQTYGLLESQSSVCQRPYFAFVPAFIPTRTRIWDCTRITGEIEQNPRTNGDRCAT